MNRECNSCLTDLPFSFFFFLLFFLSGLLNGECTHHTHTAGDGDMPQCASDKQINGTSASWGVIYSHEKQRGGNNRSRRAKVPEVPETSCRALKLLESCFFLP